MRLRRGGSSSASRSAGPDFEPRRRAFGAQAVELERVLEGVHAVPEALVSVGVQLSGRRQVLERTLFEHIVATDEVERGLFEEHEAPVDPVLEAGLLDETCHATLFCELRLAPGAARTRDGDCCEPAV